MHNPVKGKKLSKTSKGIGKKHRTMGRKDHYLPQGYLRGFISPSRAELQKPLWYFDAHRKHWSELSPAEIGFERGFYDSRGLETNVERRTNYLQSWSEPSRLSVKKWWPISSQTGLIIWIFYCDTSR